MIDNGRVIILVLALAFVGCVGEEQPDKPYNWRAAIPAPGGTHVYLTYEPDLAREPKGADLRPELAVVRRAGGRVEVSLLTTGEGLALPGGPLIRECVRVGLPPETRIQDLSDGFDGGSADPVTPNDKHSVLQKECREIPTRFDKAGS